MVKTAAKGDPLLSAQERVERAVAKVTAGVALTAEQAQWLERIKAHLAENLAIEREDFDTIPVLARAGAWVQADRVFGGKLAEFILHLNEAMAA